MHRGLGIQTMSEGRRCMSCRITGEDFDLFLFVDQYLSFSYCISWTCCTYNVYPVALVLFTMHLPICLYPCSLINHRKTKTGNNIDSIQIRIVYVHTTSGRGYRDLYPSNRSQKTRLPHQHMISSNVMSPGIVSSTSTRRAFPALTLSAAACPFCRTDPALTLRA